MTTVTLNGLRSSDGVLSSDFRGYLDKQEQPPPDVRFYKKHKISRIGIKVFQDRFLDNACETINFKSQDAYVFINVSHQEKTCKLKIDLGLFPIMRFKKKRMPKEIDLYLKDADGNKRSIVLPHEMSANLLRYLNDGKPSKVFSSLQFADFLKGVYENDSYSYRGLNKYALFPCVKGELSSGDIVVFRRNDGFNQTGVYLRDNLFLWQSSSICLKVSAYEDLEFGFSAKKVQLARLKYAPNPETETAMTEEFIAEHHLDKLEFNDRLARHIYEALLSDNPQDIRQVIESKSYDEMYRAFIEQEPKHRLNIVSCAALLGKMAFAELFLQIPADILKDAFAQEDKNRWTPLHHLALLPDGGALYKRFKATVEVNSKAHTTFYCESASMMRQMLKTETKLCRKMKIYFRNGPPSARTEECLRWADFKAKYGHLFIVPPRYFRLIPHADRVFFQRIWVSNDFSNLNPSDSDAREVVDEYLHRIKRQKGDAYLALTTTLYDDFGDAFPADLNLGLGVETRVSFKKDRLVALWGGNQSKGDDRITGDLCYTGSAGDYFSEGIEFRSFGTTVQHSFANVAQKYVGTSLGPLLLHKAIGEILPETPICYYYSSLPFVEIRPSAKKQAETPVI